MTVPLRSKPESGGRAGYAGTKRKKDSKLHLAADTPCHVLALRVTPANLDVRAEWTVSPRASKFHRPEHGIAIVDQGCAGNISATDVVKL